MIRATHCTSDVPSGFVRYVVNAYLPEAGLNIQVAQLTQRAAAIDLANLIAPEFPEAKVRISMWAAEFKELPEAKRVNAALMEALATSLQAERPGHEFLTLIGYRSKSQGA
ncbi:hypothetical protein HX823_07255 [Pseudomonas sp. P7759]|uniref:hypothetical protein n=1 Tax=Pseudomonas sp. P7759 TaxID=2738831 RepID=UPI0015A3719F|nr:hypothetical protein [Pseudomonas sp. P7759]NWC73877.1 hypothetical protein [Pseudomonas sp. P7759]